MYIVNKVYNKKSLYIIINTNFIHYSSKIVYIDKKNQINVNLKTINKKQYNCKIIQLDLNLTNNNKLYVFFIIIKQLIRLKIKIFRNLSHNLK